MRAHPAVAARRSAKALCLAGYTVSGPVAMTAMVGNPCSMAEWCATMSVPRASPLTMTGCTSVPAREETILPHHSFPYGEMSLVPTIAILFRGFHNSRVGVQLLM